MQFILTGFKQDSEFRVFAFARVEADRTKTEYTVRADLALSRKYLIPMQELPLLCRNLLAGLEDLGHSRAVTFSEEDMRLHATACAVARQAARGKKKPPQRSAGGNLGAAWRGHTRPDPAHVSTPQINSPDDRVRFSSSAVDAASDPKSND